MVKMTPSIKSVATQLRKVDRDRKVTFTILRDRKFLKIELQVDR